ncbi:MAG: hypothetical protein MUF42_02320 [Cytophagaceae bacterium]|jgi:hypothetical protein|nr:hypothetical protein [Cytophagaceae bacterium]
MQVKYTPQFLVKLEEIFSESKYILRYEKGNFQAGYCILKDQNVVVVNKYFTVEGKVNVLIEILRTIGINPEMLSDKTRKFFLEITQTEIELK